MWSVVKKLLIFLSGLDLQESLNDSEPDLDTISIGKGII